MEETSRVLTRPDMFSIIKYLIENAISSIVDAPVDKTTGLFFLATAFNKGKLFISAEAIL